MGAPARLIIVGVVWACYSRSCHWLCRSVRRALVSVKEVVGNHVLGGLGIGKEVAACTSLLMSTLGPIII